MMRPKLEGLTEARINMFLERGIYKSQAEVLNAAVALLMEQHIEEEAKTWNESDTPIEHVLSQVG